MKAAQCTWIAGGPTPDSQWLRFEGLAEHGRGKMEVGVYVEPKVVVALAEALKHTASPGHAAWHVRENNTNFAGCSSCEKVQP